MLSQNEIDAAASVLVDELNAQSQRPFVWPATFALAGAYLDQLERSGGLAPARLASARAALDGAARDPGTAALAALGRLASDVSGAAGGSSEPEKVALLASTLRELASMTPAELVAAAPRTAPLIPETPAGSPVVDVRTYAENVTRWTLGNGVQILLKPTDFQTGQVILVGFSPGGGALADDQDLGSARAAASVVGRSGLGAFTGPALRRRIAGRNVSVAPVMNEWREGIRGVAPPAELETLFQLVYLSFTAPRADERTLERWRSDQLRLRASRESTAAADFNDRWTRLRAAGPASEPLTADAVASADLERALAFYRDRFADASDFVFNLVGDFDPDDVRPLIERYLGGLPSIGRREAPPLPALPQALVDVTETTTVHAGANTRIHFSGPYEAGSARSRAELGALAIILQARLRARVGPGLGDGYFISARWATRLEPTPTYDLLVDFGSEAEPVEELVARVMDEVARLSSEPPTDGEIADARGRLGRPHDATVRQNGFWSNMLRAAEIEGVDPVAEIVGYPDALDALSSASLAEAARVLLARSRSTRLSVRLDPSVEAPWIAGAEFRARFDAENQGGFYAARIEGRFLDGRYEFRASFAPDPAGSSWQVYWGLDEAAFATRDREFTAQGFRRVWTQDFTDARGRRLTQATWMRLAP
jgi:zinc protease